MAITKPTHYAHWKDVPAEDWNWPSFSPQEIACRDPNGPAIFVVPEALDALQALRNHLGKPMILNSAYRTLSWNKHVRGSKTSKHLQGTAFDVSMANHDPLRFEAAAKNCGFSGIGHYPTKSDGRWNFMHIDLGPERFWTGDGRSFTGTDSQFSEEARETVSVAIAKNAPGAVAGGAGVVGVATLAPAVPSAITAAQGFAFSGLHVAVQLAIVLGGLAAAGGLAWWWLNRRRAQA